MAAGRYYIRLKKKIGSLFVIGLLFGPSAAAQEQQTNSIMRRIGYIGSNSKERTSPNTTAFRERLHELGYTEGQNVTIEYRYFEGKIERLPEIAGELVDLKCDVIVTTGTEAAAVAKKTIMAVPVVMAFSGDAVRLGVVTSLSRPGG